MSLRVRVEQPGGSYDVQVASGLLGRLRAELQAVVPGRRLACVTDETVAPLLDGWLGGDAPWETVLTVPAGEAHKTRASWAALTNGLLDRGFGRDSAIVAVGGGVIGDLAGFTAATFLRGIPVVQVPTTLLAMVDASVGGKVGVDTPHGKNLVGAFHPPAAVFADPQTLRSLPPREFAAGLAECVKHGLIADAVYLAEIERGADRLLSLDAEALASLVGRSVQLKAGVVARDPFEHGERAILNAGHTIGHAVEHVLGYRLLHGECVAIGLVAECRVAEAVCGLDPAVTARVAALLATLGLPTAIPADAPTDALLAAMRLDKKNRAGAIRLALPTAIGGMQHAGGAWTVAVDDSVLRRATDASRTV